MNIASEETLSADENAMGIEENWIFVDDESDFESEKKPDDHDQASREDAESSKTEPSSVILVDQPSSSTENLGSPAR